MKFIKGQISAFKGRKHTLESKKLISEKVRNNRKSSHGFQEGNKNPNFGKILSREAKEELRKINKQRLIDGTWFNQYGGYKGLENRKKEDRRNDSAYIAWRLEVYKRDNYKCKIRNKQCLGRIEAHHIFGWTEYPKLRYKINNGITLCHYHHPRKRKDEKTLIPFFNLMVEAKETNLSGAHRLGVGEINKDLKGEAYLNAIEEEMTGDHAQNEGSEEDNAS